MHFCFTAGILSPPAGLCILNFAAFIDKTARPDTEKPVRTARRQNSGGLLGDYNMECRGCFKFPRPRNLRTTTIHIYNIQREEARRFLSGSFCWFIYPIGIARAHCFDVGQTSGFALPWADQTHTRTSIWWAEPVLSALTLRRVIRLQWLLGERERERGELNDLSSRQSCTRSGNWLKWCLPAHQRDIVIY